MLDPIITTGINDDYAGIWFTWDTYMYYGYEIVKRLDTGEIVHDNGTLGDDVESEWAFAVIINKEIVWGLGHSELDGNDEPVRCLMEGIGLYLKNHYNEFKGL